MKKLTLIACVMPALFLFNGCDAASDYDKSDVYKLCVTYDYHNVGTYGGLCTGGETCPTSAPVALDTYGSLSSCSSAMNSFNANHGITDGSTSSSNTNNGSGTYLCTKITDYSDGRRYYAWSCKGGNTCVAGYSFNSEHYTAEQCNSAGDRWLYALTN